MTTCSPIRAKERTLRLAALLLPGVFACGSAAGGEATLVRSDLAVESIQLLELGEQTIVYRDTEGRQISADLQDCLALLDPAAVPTLDSPGLLVLADGQRFPGQMALDSSNDDELLAWSHPQLGRLEVPLDMIRSVLLERARVRPMARDLDVVRLTNGDRQEGFLIAIGDPIRLEVETDDEPHVIRIPLARVTAITLVTPDQPRHGRRVWLEDGTIFDARDVRVGDDGYVRLTCSWSNAGTQAIRLRLDEVAGMLFDSDRLVPLARQAPVRLEGPDTRYELPEPEVLDPEAPLGLAGLRYRGPVVVRYALPPGTRRLGAEAVLPRSARQWGDFTLRVLDDDDEVFKAHLNRERPTASINVEIRGSELAIEITPGAYGPIQDILVLDRPMLLVE